MNDETEIQTVPAIAVEALAERYARLVRRLALAWGASVTALVAVIVWAL